MSGVGLEEVTRHIDERYESERAFMRICIFGPVQWASHLSALSIYHSKQASKHWKKK